MKTLFSLILTALSINLLQAQWQQANGPYGGEISYIAISGTNIFAGTYNAGMFRSTDNGNSWTSVEDIGSTSILSLVVSGTNIFAGTFDGEIFRSTNNGGSWITLNTGLTNAEVQAIAVSGTNIFAGTNGGGVSRSTNNGNSWTTVNTGLTNTNVRCIAISGTTIFAGTNGGGIFRSTNNGGSWTTLNIGLTNAEVRAIVVSGVTIFAATNSGIIRSNDNGNSWTIVKNIDVDCIAVSGTNIFAGNNGNVLRSTDNGDSWAIVNTGFVTNSLALNGTDIFAGTWWGVYHSTNNGTSWAAMNTGLTATYVKSLAIKGTNIFAGSLNSGVLRSTNNGTSWPNANTATFMYKSVNCFAVNGTDIFAGTSVGVSISTDNGNSWNAVNTGLPQSTYVVSLAVSGTSIFAGTYNAGVFRSVNNGNSWTAVNTGLTNTQVRCIVVMGTNLFVGTAGGGVFRSIDNGNSWTAVNVGLTDTYILSAVVSGTTIFVDTWGSGVFRSTDNGNSWTAANTGLSPVNCLAVSGTNVFAGTNNGGVFRSVNNGNSWTAVNTGLPQNTFVLSLAVSGTSIFAGTSDGGVFVRPLSEMNTNLLHFPKITLASNNVVAGSPLNISLEDFLPNESALLQIKGVGNYTFSNSIPLQGNSTVAYSFPTNTSMLSGIYEITATGSVSGLSAPVKSFYLQNPTQIQAQHLKVIAPAAGAQYTTEQQVTATWQDVLVNNGSYPITGAKRAFHYIVEYSDNGGSTWVNGGAVQGEDYINSVIQKTYTLPLTTAGNNYKIRVKDGYVPSISDTSRTFTINPAAASNIKVGQLWDFSYTNQNNALYGIAADGTARIFLTVAKIDDNLGSPISKVTVSLSDDFNTTKENLGKVMAATQVSGYSSEANNASSLTATSTQPFANRHWFWYVAPDDFAGSNPQDENLRERKVKATFTIEYANSTTETKVEEITIVRPPVMLVHGLGGAANTWNDFANTRSRFINDSRFVSVVPIKLLPHASFVTNAYEMISGDNITNPSPFYSSFQDVIRDMRNKGYAVNRVDYVGHSMGGIIERTVVSKFYSRFTRTGTSASLDFKNYERGYINKLITISSPHNSSPIADLVDRYSGELSIPMRASLEGYFHIKPNALPFSFIQPKFPTPAWLPIPATFYATDAVKNLMIDGGENHSATNLKSHLIAADVFPGTQQTAHYSIPQPIISAIQQGADQVDFLNQFLKVAIAKESNQQLVSDLLEISQVEINNPVHRAMKFFERMTQFWNILVFIPESDLVVSTESQLAAYSKTQPNVSVFDSNITHCCIGKKVLGQVNVGDRVIDLLNNSIGSTSFNLIPQTNNKKENALPKEPLPQFAISSVQDTGKLNLLSPVTMSNAIVDSSLVIQFDLKDTTNLVNLEVGFQGNTYYIKPKLGITQLDIQVSAFALDTQRVYVEAFYKYVDSSVFVYDEAAVLVTTSSALLGFKAEPEITYLFKGETQYPEYYAVYQNFTTSVQSFSSRINAVINDNNVVEFDPATKGFKGIADGETFAVVSYDGISDTLYFVVRRSVIIDTNIINSIENSEVLPYKIEMLNAIAYPNPFSDNVTIEFSISEQQEVSVSIYNIQGFNVSVLKTENPAIGRNKVLFNTANLPNGIYLCEIKTAKQTEILRTILMR